MNEPVLFNSNQMVGVFKGFTEGRMEFAAEIIVPFNPEPDMVPRMGQLILVELGNPDEAILGRITRFRPAGTMASPEADEYLSAMAKQQRDIPQQIKEAKLRYSVNVKLLGGLRIIRKGGTTTIEYVPSVRTLPHLGAQVAYPTPEVISYLCRLGARQGRDVVIGHYTLGEYVFNGNSDPGETFLVPCNPALEVHFDIDSLISKRTFVFARAGYGKSNLQKLLLCKLFENGRPKTTVGSQNRPVGILVLDPEGEYFWPDQHGRPGLCDVPHLKDYIAVFTDREPPHDYYGKWKIGPVRLNLAECLPSEIANFCIPEERQEQQNVAKIRGLNRNLENWKRLIKYLADEGHNADENEISNIVGFKGGADNVEARAIRSNLVPIIQSLHDSSSNLINLLPRLLGEGYLVIVDLSVMSTRVGLWIASMLLNKLFVHNQENFVRKDGLLIPCVAVIEEAQTVLGKNMKEDSPFVRWVKEGRKYGLGAIMVTQQPGSIAPELLSQGDNFFVFHLLSAYDLRVLQSHNAHFSDDILTHLLNEPIRGNMFFWSAPNQPFVLPARVLNFEKLYPKRDVSKYESGEGEDQGAVSQKLNKERKEMVKLLLDTLENNQSLKFYIRVGTPGSVYVYEPNLCAALAEALDEEKRKLICNFYQDKWWMKSEQLELIVKDSKLSPGGYTTINVSKKPKPYIELSLNPEDLAKKGRVLHKLDE